MTVAVYICLCVPCASAHCENKFFNVNLSLYYSKLLLKKNTVRKTETAAITRNHNSSNRSVIVSLFNSLMSDRERYGFCKGDIVTMTMSMTVTVIVDV